MEGGRYTVDAGLSAIGMGWFQYDLLVRAGCGALGAGMQQMLTSYLGPATQEELKLSLTDQNLMALFTFAAILIGAIFWGFVADKCGRRRSVLGVALVTSSFGLASAFAQSGRQLMILQVAVGFGIGGSQMYSTWYMEFVPRAHRGSSMTCFFAFASAGGTLLEAFLAWIIMEKVVPEHSWRWLIAVTSIPSIVGLIVCYYSPESPIFLCTHGRFEEAVNVLDMVATINDRVLPQGRLVNALSSQSTLTTPLLAHSTENDTESCYLTICMLLLREWWQTTVPIWRLSFTNTCKRLCSTLLAVLSIWRSRVQTTIGLLFSTEWWQTSFQAWISQVTNTFSSFWRSQVPTAISLLFSREWWVTTFSYNSLVLLCTRSLAMLFVWRSRVHTVLLVLREWLQTTFLICRAYATNKFSILLTLLSQLFVMLFTWPSRVHADIRMLFSRGWWRTTIPVWLLYFTATFSYSSIVSLISPSFVVLPIWPYEVYQPSFYLDALIVSISELPGLGLAYWLMDWFGRKYTMAIMYVGGCILSLLQIIGWNTIVATLLMFCIRMAMSATFVALEIYVEEVYPANLRATAVGVATIWGWIGSMAWPALGDQLETSKHPILIVCLYAFKILISAVCAFFLPINTLDRA